MSGKGGKENGNNGNSFFKNTSLLQVRSKLRTQLSAVESYFFERWLLAHCEAMNIKQEKVGCKNSTLYQSGMLNFLVKTCYDILMNTWIFINTCKKLHYKKTCLSRNILRIKGTVLT